MATAVAGKMVALVTPYVRMLRRLSRPKTVVAQPGKAPSTGLNVRFDIVETPNKRWGQSERGHRITVPRNPIIDRKTRIFTMGSCFAIEIRAAFEQRGFEVFPKYQQIPLDAARQRFEDDVTHYDTFTIRQEFEQALLGRHFAIDDFLSHTHKLTNHFEAGGRVSWQDPYRKRVFAADEGSVLDLSRKIDDCIADGIRQSDVYIITLGLIETWRNTKNGFHICLPPYDDKRGGMDKFGDIKFHHSNYAESYENLRRVCSLIQQHYPQRKIVLTVSPVGLGRTYTDNDVVVATIEAKSILRAATSQICKEFSNVTYWPSYELCTKDDIYREDGRHVRRDAVAMIVDAFIEAHVADPANA